MINKEVIISSVVWAFVTYMLLVVLTAFLSPFGLFSYSYVGLDWQTISTKESGVIIRAQFSSPEDNLGVIILPFKSFSESPSYPVTFTLRDVTKSQSLISTTQESAAFALMTSYPFGLTDTHNKKHTRYELELSSKNRNIIPLIVLDKRKGIETVHFSDKSEVFNSTYNFLRFLQAKLKLIMRQLTIWPVCILYVIFAIISLIKNRLKSVSAFSVRKKGYFAAFLTNKNGLQSRFDSLRFFVVVISTLFFLPTKMNDTIILVWVSLYVSLTILTALKNEMHYIIAFVLLILCQIQFISGNDLGAENSAIMIFIILCVGCISEIMDKLHPRDRIFSLTNLPFIRGRKNH